jgi:hypothetical protein
MAWRRHDHGSHSDEDGTSDAGALEANQLASLSLSLDVTRAQFSDMLPRIEAHRFKDFHFTVEEKDAEGRWPVRSWGMGTAPL